MHKWLDPKTGRWRTKGSPRVSRRVVTAHCPHVERVDVAAAGCYRPAEARPTAKPETTLDKAPPAARWVAAAPWI
jgi:hypothetical protein